MSILSRIVSPSWLALALLAPGLAAGCAHHHHGSMAGMPGPGIRISAEGRSSATPDEARVTLGVFTEAATADEATRDNATRQSQILAAVKPLVGAGGQVTTQGFQLFPVTPEGKPVRFQVRNTVEIRTGAIKDVGRIIDVAVASGANEVQSLSFGLKDPSGPRQEALTQAAARARTEAETLAKALGLTITGIVSVENETSSPPVPLPMMRFAKAEMSAATPIEAGQVDVNATVTITFDVARR